MSQFISHSPQEDDQLPSFMEQQQSSSSAGPSESTPERKNTRSPRHAHTHSHPHSHAHSHSHSHSHAHTPQSQQSQQSRGWSTASASSLGIPGCNHEGARSRSMSRTRSHELRETLDAKSKDLEDGSRIINQYRITDVIGRGAYGTVRKAILDQDPCTQFAVKEFGKTRLRKSHRAVDFRKPARGPRRSELNRDEKENRFEPPPDAGNPKKEEQDESKDPLTLVRREIAILKKLHHPNVVKLFEVLDDPSKDSLYMVFEFCPDGTVIDVKLNEEVQPLPEDVARLYFVQVLMGIEYLHENQIVHRDIKPDNILLSDDRKTCKIVDFGVSEMFLKPGDDTMQESAGSPAFMSPELCTAGHAEYHGKSDDIWSFGVTLYCMVVGHLPFNKHNFYEMYEAIKNDEPDYPSHLSEDLKDLLQNMLAKDPEKRITVPQMRQHPWTNKVEPGILLSREENVEAVISEITDEDLDCAICNTTNIFTFARAISRFKKGASVLRARNATRSTSGGSEVDKDDSSCFPKDEAPSGASTQEGKQVQTIKEETPPPASKEERQKAGEQKAGEHKTEQGGAGRVEEQVQGLQKAAAFMFESPQMHTFELPPEEPNGNGPLQRNRSGPISTIHKPEPAEDENGPPVITMHPPQSASPPAVFASPTSEDENPFDASDISKDVGRSSGHGTATVVAGSSKTSNLRRSSGTDPAATDFAQDGCKPREEEQVASHLRDMMIDHDQKNPSSSSSSDGGNGNGRHTYESPAKQHNTRQEQAFQHKHQHSRDREQAEKEKPQHAKTVQERAAKLVRNKSQPRTKILPDQPTVASPAVGTIKNPPDAADVYRQAGVIDMSAEADGKTDDHNPYFSTTLDATQQKTVAEDQKNASEDEQEQDQSQRQTICTL
ncbi:related to calcium/calmodulin dependent protein kinase C [Ustilago sp. UG-2017a]|nr:related to calcium/calmodulin dependent protein kinase C [Ustilago sp. UG-2017a]